MLGAKATARAKINLFLDVGPRREDGYHEIRSVMQSLELSDELYFRRTDGSEGRIVLKCNDRCVPCGGDNLAWKAVEVLVGRTGVLTDGGVEAFINKRIPVGSGLAGGSADAAAALLAMDHMFELELERKDLEEMALEVGSDVPFCLRGGTALVSGRGERIEPLEPLPPFHVVVASTGEEASTGEVYGAFDELGSGSGVPAKETLDGALSGLLDAIVESSFEGVCDGLHNSLELAAADRDRVERYKSAARGAGARAALMTGSGPAVFVPALSLEDAAGVAWELEKMAPITIITSFALRGAEITG